MDVLVVSPNVPIVAQNGATIPSRIWKRFLTGTYTWMAASII